MKTNFMTRDEALNALIVGNRRYAADRQVRPHQGRDRRDTLLDSQEPFAVIVSCSDSRVPSEIIFDQGLGDLFIVRMAGHVVNDMVIASVEFAVHALEVPLVVVMGHASCGAVKSAVSGISMPGMINQLVQEIQPAVNEVRGQEGDLIENAIRANARRCAAQIIARSSVIREAVEQGRVGVTPAFYELSTGLVEWLMST